MRGPAHAVGHGGRQPGRTRQHRCRTSRPLGRHAPTSRAEQEEPWLDQAPGVLPAGRGPRHVAPGRWTTTGSSPSSPAPCARSRPPHSAGRSRPSNRTKFQAVALLMREERARVKVDTDDQRLAARRADEAARRRGARSWRRRRRATPRHRAARRGGGRVRGAKALKRDMQISAGMELRRRTRSSCRAAPVARVPERQVVPQAVVPRQLANPFLPPDFALADQPVAHPRRLANWELFGPLFKSFEYGAGGGAASMPLPEPTTSTPAPGATLMQHQAELVESAAPGPPHLPARRRARPRQDGPVAARREAATRTRCSSSCPTSSRPTGPARSSSGRRPARPR